MKTALELTGRECKLPNVIVPEQGHSSLYPGHRPTRTQGSNLFQKYGNNQYNQEGSKMSYLETDPASNSAVTGSMFRQTTVRPLNLVTHGFKVKFKPKSMGRSRNAQDAQTRTTSIATQSCRVQQLQSGGRDKRPRFGGLVVAEKPTMGLAESLNGDIGHLRVSENFSAKNDTKKGAATLSEADEQTLNIVERQMESQNVRPFRTREGSRARPAPAGKQSVGLSLQSKGIDELTGVMSLVTSEGRPLETLHMIHGTQLLGTAGSSRAAAGKIRSLQPGSPAPAGREKQLEVSSQHSAFNNSAWATMNAKGRPTRLRALSPSDKRRAEQERDQVTETALLPGAAERERRPSRPTDPALAADEGATWTSGGRGGQVPTFGNRSALGGHGLFQPINFDQDPAPGEIKLVQAGIILTQDELKELESYRPLTNLKLDQNSTLQAPLTYEQFKQYKYQQKREFLLQRDYLQNRYLAQKRASAEEPAGTGVTELRQSVSEESRRQQYENERSNKASTPDLAQRKPISLMGFQKLNKDLGVELDPQVNRGDKISMKDAHRNKEIMQIDQLIINTKAAPQQAATAAAVNPLDGELQAIVEQTNEGSRKLLLAQGLRPVAMPRQAREHIMTSSNEQSNEAERSNLQLNELQEHQPHNPIEQLRELTLTGLDDPSEQPRKTVNRGPQHFGTSVATPRQAAAPFNKVYRGYKSPVVALTGRSAVEQGSYKAKYKYVRKVTRDARYYRELLDREWYEKNGQAPAAEPKSPKRTQKEQEEKSPIDCTVFNGSLLAKTKTSQAHNNQSSTSTQVERDRQEGTQHLESALSSPASPARAGAAGAPGRIGKPIVASYRTSTLQADWPQSGRATDSVKLDALCAVTNQQMNYDKLRIEPDTLSMSREDNFRMHQGKNKNQLYQTLNISEDLDVVSLRDIQPPAEKISLVVQTNGPEGATTAHTTANPPLEGMDHLVKNLTNRQQAEASNRPSTADDQASSLGADGLDAELLSADLILTPRTITPFTQQDLHVPLSSVNRHRNNQQILANYLAALASTDPQLAHAKQQARSTKPKPLLQRPKFRMVSRTLNPDRQKVITNPRHYPYPAYPLRETEGIKTQIQHHGGFWDYFTIAKRQEGAWLQKQKEILRNDPQKQAVLRANITKKLPPREWCMAEKQRHSVVPRVSELDVYSYASENMMME